MLDKSLTSYGMRHRNTEVFMRSKLGSIYDSQNDSVDLNIGDLFNQSKVDRNKVDNNKEQS
jgi:hypothetical protein